MLRDVAAEPGALPLLSHALRATWERRDGRTLTVEGYRESGGVASAIARTADAVVDALPDDAAADSTRGVFLRMTELGEGIEDTRRRVTVDELVPEGASRDTVRALLERLADARLVTLDDGTAEVAHEALIREWPRLRGWLDEDRAGDRARTASSATPRRVWDAGGRETVRPLPRRPARRRARAAAGRAELNATERAFLDASVAEAERERRAEQRVNRRLRGLLAVGAVLLVAAVAGAALSLVSRDNARDGRIRRRGAGTDLRRRARRRAGARRRRRSSESMLLRRRRGRARGSRRDPRLPAHGPAAEPGRGPRSPAVERSTSPHSRSAPTAGCWRAATRTGVVRFTDLRTWKPSGATVDSSRPFALQAMVFSPDGRTLAVGTRQSSRSELHLIDVTTHGEPPDRVVGRARPGQLSRSRRRSPSRPTAAASRSAWRHVSQRADGPSAPAPPAPRRAQRAPAVAAPLPAPARPDGGAGQVPATTAADHLGRSRARRWCGTRRTGRIVRRYPIGGRFALSPDGRRLALALNSRHPGDAELVRGAARPAHRPPSQARRPTCPRSGS